MDYRFFRHLRKNNSLKTLFWKIRPSIVKSPFCCGLWQSLMEGNRLSLPSLGSEVLHELALQEVVLPGTRDPGHGADAPLPDLVFLLQLTKLLKPARILEIGTYRAKTTYAFGINLPDAFLVSYDIARVESPYRDILEKSAGASLRICDFSKNVETSNETPFNFIFIDAGHRLKEVLDDSEKAFQALAPGGCVVWHDYRLNEFFNPGLEVPEAMKILSKDRPIFSIPGTTCAAYQEGLAQAGKFLPLAAE